MDPGLACSGPGFEAFVTTVAYIILSFVMVFVLGVWAGVAYEFFLWGWRWFQ